MRLSLSPLNSRQEEDIILAEGFCFLHVQNNGPKIDGRNTYTQREAVYVTATLPDRHDSVADVVDDDDASLDADEWMQQQQVKTDES